MIQVTINDTQNARMFLLVGDGTETSYEFAHDHKLITSVHWIINSNETVTLRDQNKNPILHLSGNGKIDFIHNQIQLRTTPSMIIDFSDLEDQDKYSILVSLRA